MEMSHLPQVSRSLSLPQGVESDVNSACPQVDVTSVRGVTSELAHHELSEEGEKKRHGLRWFAWNWGVCWHMCVLWCMVSVDVSLLFD